MQQKTLAELRGNMTQRELAKHLSLTPSSIAMYETGERTPPLKKAIKIANFFGVPVESIEFGEDARKTRTVQSTGTDG